MYIKLTTIDDIKDFVSKAMEYKYNIDMISGRYRVDAKSIMGIFSLNLDKPVEIIIENINAAGDFVDSISSYIVTKTIS